MSTPSTQPDPQQPTHHSHRATRRLGGRRLMTGAGVLAAGGLVAMAAAANATSGSADTPSLLEAAELPPAATDWAAGEVESGTGTARFCLPQALPQDGSYHRDFRTELETSAHQLVFQAKDEQAAEKLVKQLNTSIANCAADFEQRHPDGKAEYKEYGDIPAGDGGWVHGIGTEVPNAAKDVHLIGVGWNGDKVTVVGWGEYGTLGDISADDFTTTVETAMGKLD